MCDPHLLYTKQIKQIKQQLIVIIIDILHMSPRHFPDIPMAALSRNALGTVKDGATHRILGRFLRTKVTNPAAEMASMWCDHVCWLVNPMNHKKGGFLKHGYLKMDGEWKIMEDPSMIWVYPHFRKSPYGYIVLYPPIKQISIMASACWWVLQVQSIIWAPWSVLNLTRDVGWKRGSSVKLDS